MKLCKTYPFSNVLELCTCVATETVFGLCIRRARSMHLNVSGKNNYKQLQLVIINRLNIPT